MRAGMTIKGAAHVEVKNVFRSTGTGVHLQPMLKVIAPTLTKRRHHFPAAGFADSSIPFKTGGYFRENHQRLMMLLNQYKGEHREEETFKQHYEEHQLNEAVIAAGYNTANFGA